MIIKSKCLGINLEYKINEDNINLMLSEIDDFVKPYQSSGNTENGNEVYNDVMNILSNTKKM